MSRIRWFTMLLALLAAGALWALHERQEASAAPAPPRYAALLKDPSLLGFEPTPAMFGGLYVTVRDSYVDPVSDDQLFRGVVSEVGVLLAQAGVGSEGLARLDRSRDVLKQLAALYGSQVPEKLLTYAAMQGLVTSLGDEASVLMGPEDYRKNYGRTEPSAGIGIYMELVEGALTVFEAMEGSPAAAAGIQSGDRIVAIDSRKMQGQSLESAQAALRGPAGSQVVLQLAGAGEAKLRELTVTRDVIRVSPVTARMLPGGVGYLRLRIFSSASPDAVQSALDELRRAGARALVLDLRNNSGGYLSAAVEVAGRFTGPEALVLVTEDRKKRRKEYSTSSGEPLGLPLAVLINRYSASASEILAAALREHADAKVVGERSFGAGTIQQLFPFPSGPALKLTVARVYGPSGTPIAAGLMPDVSVEMPTRLVGRAEGDVQLEKAVEAVTPR